MCVTSLSLSEAAVPAKRKSSIALSLDGTKITHICKTSCRTKAPSTVEESKCSEFTGKLPSAPCHAQAVTAPLTAGLLSSPVRHRVCAPLGHTLSQNHEDLLLYPPKPVKMCWLLSIHIDLQWGPKTEVREHSEDECPFLVAG